MASSESQVSRSLEETADAVAVAVKALKNFEDVLRGILREAETQSDLLSVILSVHPSDQREEVNDALIVMEKTRHQLRSRIFALGLDRGMTMSELGRAWGFSRQFAARLAKESETSAN